MPLGANKAAIMGVAGVSTADVVLVSSQTADNDASLSFTGLDSTYGVYIFKFYKIDGAADRGIFQVQFNADGESGYNETITSTAFRANHFEDASEPFVTYTAAEDQAQGTDFNYLVGDVGFTGNECAAGELKLFNPSSTTYTTHWMSEVQTKAGGYYLHHSFNAGYVNTTAAITDVQFKLHNGNMYGTIKMWGVK